MLEPLERYLRRRAHSSDVEDALSDVMHAVWRRLDDAPGEHLLPWCYGIARRVLANQRRGHNRHLRLLEKMASQPAPAPTPGQADAGPELELARALASLADDDREVLPGASMTDEMRERLADLDPMRSEVQTKPTTESSRELLENIMGVPPTQETEERRRPRRA